MEDKVDVSEVTSRASSAKVGWSTVIVWWARELDPLPPELPPRVPENQPESPGGRGDREVFNMPHKCAKDDENDHKKGDSEEWKYHCRGKIGSHLVGERK